MPVELRTEVHAHEAITASRIVPLRRMAPARPSKPPASVVRPLFIPEQAPFLPKSWKGWAVCGALLVWDVAPFVYLYWRFG